MNNVFKPIKYLSIIVIYSFFLAIPLCVPSQNLIVSSISYFFRPCIYIFYKKSNELLIISRIYIIFRIKFIY